MLQIYSIDDRYITELKIVDGKVSNNYGGNKPYVGLMFTSGQDSGIRWYAPLCSEKEKYKSITSQTAWAHLIHALGNPDERLGMLDFRNLIPAPDCALKLYPFARIDEKYKLMIQSQYQFIKANAETIERRSQQLFKLAYLRKSEALAAKCCDFVKLEAASLHYKC